MQPRFKAKAARTRNKGKNKVPALEILKAVANLPIDGIGSHLGHQSPPSFFDIQKGERAGPVPALSPSYV